MGSSVKLVLIGGLISLVSTLAGIFIKYWLDEKKLETQIKVHPIQVLYNKQTEFFDKLAPILLEINGYITIIDVWLRETTGDAKKRVQKAASNNSSVAKFDDLLQQYYMYLPEKLLNDAKELHSQCMSLGNSPSQKLAYDSINKLFSFQNTIREFVGIDKLSCDLLKAFGSQKEKDQKS